MVSSPPVAGEDLLVEDGPVGAEEGHRVQRLRAIPINKYIVQQILKTIQKQPFTIFCEVQL